MLGCAVIKAYYRLAKPGIIAGNSITAAAGFGLASGSDLNFKLFLAALSGLALIIGSAAVFNNYIDRDIDVKMSRTKKRALASGLISNSHAIVYGAVLGLAGCAVLLLHTNLLTAGLAVFGFISYVVIYGIWKRRSSIGTLVGSVSGAVPPVVGYAAVSNRLDAAAVILFFTVALWQMPHFYAIAIYRLKDYKAASIPVLPAEKGIARTKTSMTLYIAAFILAASMLSFLGHTGPVYLIVVSLLGLAWLRLSISGLRARDDKLWARGMFRFSLLVITGLSVMIMIDSIILG